MSNYKKLDVWTLSMSTVKEIYDITKFYPVEEKFGLTTQTNRAAISIPSNIAEGLGRNYKKDTIQFLLDKYSVEQLIAKLRFFVKQAGFTPHSALYTEKIVKKIARHERTIIQSRASAHKLLSLLNTIIGEY